MASVPLSNGMKNAIFPIEIFTEIFQHPDMSYLGIDRQELFSIPLVCKAFLALVRPHIFKTISLSPELPQAGVYMLAQMFRDQPKLAMLVQEITYGSDVIKVEAIHHNGNLEPLFKLPNVRELVVSRGCKREIGGCYYHFSDESLWRSGARTLVEQYLRVGSLSTLIMNRIANIPMHQILNSPMLEYLRLFFCHAVEEMPPPSGTRYNLKKFSSDSSTKIPLVTIARCTQLVDLVLNSSLLSPTTKAMVEMYQDNPQARPFDKLEKADFTRFPKWDTFYHAAESLGIAAFPSLERLYVTHPPKKRGMESIPSENPDRFLRHTPTLKTVSWKVHLTASRPSLAKPSYP